MRYAWLVLAACSTHHAATVDDAPITSEAVPSTCSTRITYGAAWMAPANHADQFDEVADDVTWDGTCTDDGANSYATLSNGFKPYFKGHSACVIALDKTATCATAAAACTTRISYGAGWIAAANHTTTYDDVDGRVFGDGVCTNASYTTLSNGFAPHFANGSCPISWRYEQCGGLYTNPAIPHDCADPGVLADGDRYILSCTSGDAAMAFPIYTSPDLATWTPNGHIFPTKPTWATNDYWAPEIHKVGTHYVAYFSARATADGKLSIGAASADNPLGPFTDLGQPLIHDANMGLIDASEFTTSQGTPYVLWKEDGNAVGMPTPIHIAQLSDDGMSVKGAPSTLITNDKTWEGAVTEGPFLVEHGGMFYLFYSGNSYANASYAVGVARGTSLTAMMEKPANPIVVTNENWVGPGHCSVVTTPHGTTALVYHAWVAGCVDQPGCGREVLTDLIQWGSDGWPTVPLAPSSTTRPLP